MTVDDLVPILLLVLRTSFLPTTLRSSSLTILTTAVETAPVSLLPHTPTLTEACLTLLSLESRPLLPRKRAVTPPPPSSTTDSDDEDELLPPPSAPPAKLRKPEETPTPTSSNSQHPSLRRSAILFLGILFRTSARLADASSSSSTRQTWTTGYDPSNPLGQFRMGSKDAGPTRSALVGRAERQRAKVVLAYLRATDEDALVRYQAGEVLDELEEQ